MFAYATDTGEIGYRDSTGWKWGNLQSSLPGAHASTHISGGSDSVKLDDLAVPDDNTDLNASASRHGLLPKLPDDSGKYLNGAGSWATVSAGLTQDQILILGLGG
jgi:hypothetical protein